MPSAPKERKKNIKKGGSACPPVPNMSENMTNDELEAAKAAVECNLSSIAKDANARGIDRRNFQDKQEEQEKLEETAKKVRKELEERTKNIQILQNLNVEKIETANLEQLNLIEDKRIKVLLQQLQVLDAALKRLQARKIAEDTILVGKQQILTDVTTRNTNSKTRLQNAQNSREAQKNFRDNTEYVAKATVKTWDRLIWWPLLALGRLLVKIGQSIRGAWPIIKQVTLALFTFLFNHRKSAFAPYFTLFLVICLILGLIGFVALASSDQPESDKEKERERDAAPPPIVETEDGPVYQMSDGTTVPVREDQPPPPPPQKSTTSWFSMPSFSMPRFITDGFDRLVPTYKAAMIAQNIAPFASPIHVPELQTNPREKIVGRCDNLKYMETSLKSGEGGMCTTTDIPKPITWVMDITKSDDYKNLPDQIKKRIGSDGSKNKVTIPWKSDGFVYSPDCEKATFADGTPANLYNDHGEFCKKKEVDKIKYKDAWRIKKEYSYYKGIDTFE